MIQRFEDLFCCPNVCELRLPYATRSRQTHQLSLLKKLLFSWHSSFEGSGQGMYGSTGYVYMRAFSLVIVSIYTCYSFIVHIQLYYCHSFRSSFCYPPSSSLLHITMKYNLTLLSILGLNLGLTLAQDAQSLMAVGFPECAVSFCEP